MNFLAKLFLILAIVFVSCERDKNPCHLSETVLKDLNKIDSFTYSPKFKERNRRWKKENYKEPLLTDTENETYRFIRHTPFNGAEIYRIENRDDKYFATLKTFGHNDTVGTFKEFEITNNTWDNIVDSLNLTDFWTYPSTEDRQFLDAEGWLLEGFKPIKDKCTLRNYHIIARASPIDTTFIAMCKLFFRLDQNKK